MEKFLGYIIAKVLELVFFTIAIATYSNLAYPSGAPDLTREIYLSFAIILTFFIVSLYALTSLATHLVFQNRRFFGLFCVGAYGISALMFVVLNPMGGVENILVLTLPVPVIYLIGSLAKLLALKLRPEVPS